MGGGGGRGGMGGAGWRGHGGGMDGGGRGMGGGGWRGGFSHHHGRDENIYRGYGGYDGYYPYSYAYPYSSYSYYNYPYTLTDNNQCYCQNPTVVKSMDMSVLSILPNETKYGTCYPRNMCNPQNESINYCNEKYSNMCPVVDYSGYNGYGY